MVLYSQADKMEIIIIYGETGRNSVKAQELYAQCYSDRNHPSRRYFNRIIHLFLEIGSMNTLKRKRRETKTNEEAEIAVPVAVAHDPQISCRQIECYSGISKTSVLRILRHHKFHPYHISLHQEVHGEDFENRVQFCKWALRRLQINPNFFDNVLFIDESIFTNHG